MKKIKKSLSAILAASMFLSNAAYAGELADTENVSTNISSAVSYGVDKIKNTVSDLFSTDLSNDAVPEENAETEFQDPGMDLTQSDIQALYDMGYELPDIEDAMQLSAELNKTPYELLQLKGKTKYIPHEVEQPNIAAAAEAVPNNQDVDQQEETVVSEQPEYEFTTDEKSWENVAMELNNGDTTIDENQWEYIKLSGVDQYIDPSMLSDEEKQALAAVGSEEAGISAQAASSADMTEIYNDYIFPSSIYANIEQGGYVNSDDFSVNELTGNNVVQETDISLAGRNGLDLNVNRYYSLSNASNYDATVHKGSGSSTYKSSKYYGVCVVPYVTIVYNEPLADGSTSKSFYVDGVYIAPGRVNYNRNGAHIVRGMFVSDEAYQEDIARLNSGQAPKYLFDTESAANTCVSYAASGLYNYNIQFSDNSKIKSVKYDLSDSSAEVYPVANGKTFTVMTDTSTYYNDTAESRHSKYFNIGRGWSFDFPYIEIRQDAIGNDSYEYLHMGTNGVWQIDESNKLVGYNLKDMTLTSGGSFNGKTTKYILTEKTGKKYYFGAIGQLLGIEDRYGNKILFEYDEITDSGKRYPRLKKITDTVGRVVTITYTESKVTLTVTDKNDASQNRTIEYSISDDNLTSVKNAQGYITNYEYYDDDYEVSMLSKSLDRPSVLTYSLLSRIYYPTGLMKEVNYSDRTQNFGIGGVGKIPICTGNKTYETQLNEETGEVEFDKYRSMDNYVWDSGNQDTSVTYDGYPTFRSIQEVPEEYRIHSYHTCRQDNYMGDHVENNTIYRISKDKNWLRESVSTSFNEFRGDVDLPPYKTTTEYTYDKNEQLTKETTRTYHDYTNDKNTYMETSKEYTYDTALCGDLLSVKINGETNRTTSYTYDSAYHLPTKQTYKKDNNTTVETKYTLTSDKKSTETVTATENNTTKRKRTYEYDSYGNVISEKRYSGNNNWNDYLEIAYSYDDTISVSNKLNGVYVNSITVSGMKDVDGNTLDDVSQSYTYDWYGNTISETDANGNTYSYTYDKLNRLTKAVNPDGSAEEYTFTVNYGENSVQKKDANGGIIKHSYDQFGLQTAETDVTNNVVLSERQRQRVDYHLAHNVIQHSTENGDVTTQTVYNPIGEPVEETVFDSNNNILSHTITEYEYAADGQYNKLIRTIYGDTDSEAVKNIQYTDKYGNVVKEEVVYNDNGAEKSAVAEYTYDLLGNRLTVREPRAKEEGWSANEYTAKYEYDIAGNVTKETDINGKSIVNTYDGLGNLVSVKDKNGNTSTTTYDALGRILKEQIPFQKNGTSTVYAENKYYYDANGNTIKSQTANNAAGSDASYTTTEYTYNWQNQPTKVNGYDGTAVKSCVQYYYDSVGNVLRMYTGNINNLVINGLDSLSGTTSNYAVTKYEYDSMNRCISQTDALGQTVSNTYDINGNLTQTTDRNGNVLSYSYDGLNQLISKSSDKSAEDTYTYGYNMKGFRTSMTGGGVDTTSVYDNLGRLTKETLTDGTVKEYTYDINGNRKSFKLTKDNAVQYTLTYDYDKQNQLTKVYEDGKVKAEYTYNPDGTLKKSSYGSRTTDYSYNLAQLLTEVNNANGSTQISKYSYTYYVDGNQKTKEESVAGTSVGTTTYTYDGLNRLKKEQAPDKTYNYTYDYYGNRSQLSVSGGESYTASYVYDKNNRLTKQTKTSGKVSDITEYWYDPNGNQISSMTITSGVTPANRAIAIEPAGGSSNSINEYDSWNQLTKTMQNGKTASYTYNGDGLRMSKTVDGTTTSHIWDGTNIAGDVTNGTVTKYIRGLQLISSKKGSSESFYNFNSHGDVVQLTNGSGNITKQYSYDAFGVEQDKADNDTNPFRYCGEYYDGETDSIYLRARYYSPMSGRFITEDPIGDGWNWYVYCYNNPVIFIDPSGLDIYYFVSSQFKNQGDKDAETLKDEYSEPIHVIEIRSKQEFIDQWNWMGFWDGKQVNVSLVVINMHGDPSGLYPTDEKADKIVPEELISKNIGGMILLVCNAGHYDHRNSNFAHQMLVQNNVGFVTAADGEVAQANIGPRTWFDKGVKYTTLDGGEFYENNWEDPELGNRYRRNFGFIKYTKNANGELETFRIDAKNPRTELYITQLN